MKKLIVVVLIMVSFLGFSQAPLVPKTMKFADLDLHISNSARAQIQKSVNSLHKSPTYFNKMREQADIFFPIIEAEFKKTNFPDDIKYLCIQESAFVSDAVSSSNAVGYWQFKEATAIEQGLDVDRVVDERKNIVSASEAAAK